MHHGGNTIGFTSDLAFLSDARSGIVVLTNAGRANDFVQAVRARFLESLLGLPDTEHSRAMIAREERSKRDAAMTGAAPIPDDAARAAQGRYISTELGEVELRLDPVRPNGWVIWDGPLMDFPVKPSTNAAGRATLVVGEGAAAYEFVAEERE